MIPRWTMAMVLSVMGMAQYSAMAMTEELSRYQGDPVTSNQGITFDGQAFTVPGQAPVSRNEVQSVFFHGEKGNDSLVLAESTNQSLSPEAKTLLPRAVKLGAQYPGASGVVLLDDGEFVRHKDGTDLYRYHFAGLVLKEEMKSWAQVSMSFIEGRSRVRLLYALAVGSDGTVHSLDDNALKTGSPSEEMQFFNPNHKVRSGVIPGVDVGAVVEYVYEYENYNPEDPRLFSPGYVFQGEEPIVLSRVRIDMPTEIALHYVTRQWTEPEKAKPVITENDGIRSYRWQMEDVPPLTKEPMMPPEHDLVPILETSIFKDWAEVSELLRKLQLARLQSTDAIKKQVETITKNASSLEEKIALLYYWVQENTHYISIKGSLGAGFSGHTAQETFENRYGDCTDKSILFCTMLKNIGVEAFPIIVTTNDFGNSITEIPTLGGNHCISELCVNGRNFYLDTTTEDYRYPYVRADDHGVTAFNAIRGDLKTIPVPPPADNRRFSHMDLALDAKGNVTAKTRNEYNGFYEAGIRGYWKQVRDTDRKLRMTEYVNSLSPGAVLQDFTLNHLEDLSKPLTMAIDFALPGHAIRAKDLMYLRMPTLERDYPEVALETRRHPIQHMTTEERSLEMDLTLPAKFHAKWLPPPLNIDSPYVAYHAGYEERDGHILFKETFQRLQRIVPVADYPAYRDALRQIAAFSKQEIFLTEKGGRHE